MAILGGHEHTPFAGRMGHGANAAARIAQHRTASSTSSASRRARVRQRGIGTLCVKAGMDAENVVVVTVDVPASARAGPTAAARATRTPPPPHWMRWRPPRRARRRWLTPRARTGRVRPRGAWRARRRSRPRRFGKDAEDAESCAFESEATRAAPRRRTTSCPRSLTPERRRRPRRETPASPAAANRVSSPRRTPPWTRHAGAAPRDPTAPSVAPGRAGRRGGGDSPGIACASPRACTRCAGAARTRWTPTSGPAAVLRGLSRCAFAPRARRAAWNRAALFAGLAVRACSLGTVRHDFAGRVPRGRVPVQLRRHPRQRRVRLGPLTYGDLVAVPFGGVVTLEMSGAELARAVALPRRSRSASRARAGAGAGTCSGTRASTSRDSS